MKEFRLKGVGIVVEMFELPTGFFPDDYVTVARTKDGRVFKSYSEGPFRYSGKI